MTKFELVKEIYTIQNRINILNGRPEHNLEDSWVVRDMHKEADNNAKHNLLARLESLQKTHFQYVSQKEKEKKIAAFYATPVGVKIKQEMEALIESKIKEWKNYDALTAKKLEELIQLHLGKHWEVIHFDKGYMKIAVIDKIKSTPEHNEYYFGQDIGIRYEIQNWLQKGTEEKFETNVATCGSFNVEGGKTIGERAMFYVGIGKLLDNPQLLQTIKDTLKTSVTEIERISKELDNLRKQLAHPALMEGLTEENSNLKTQNHESRKLHF